MLADVGPVTVLATTGTAGLLPPGHPVPILVDDQTTGAAPEATAVTAPARLLHVLDAAYVIYTSGSTGRPKGVVVTHEGVAKLVATARDRLGVGPDSRVLQFASPEFDVTFFELCMGLLLDIAALLTALIGTPTSSGCCGAHGPLPHHADLRTVRCLQ